MKAVSIHKASSSHADAIASLAQQLAMHENSVTFCNRQAVAARMNGTQEPRCQWWVALDAENEDEVVGFAMGYVGYDLSSDSVGMHLCDLVVDRAKRRQGIGRALMKQVAVETLQQKGEWISLTVLKENSSGIGFYEAMQWQQVPVRFLAAGRSVLYHLSE